MKLMSRTALQENCLQYDLALKLSSKTFHEKLLIVFLRIDSVKTNFTRKTDFSRKKIAHRPH